MIGRYESFDTRLRRTMRVKRAERIVAESALGTVVGAVTGAVAGPPGVVAGAIIGFLIGLLAGVVGEQEERRAALKERRMDAELGITAVNVSPPWVRHFTPMPRGRW